MGKGLKEMRKKVDKLAEKKKHTDEEIDFMADWVLKECEEVQREEGDGL